jgi:hypothetical protein
MFYRWIYPVALNLALGGIFVEEILRWDRGVVQLAMSGVLVLMFVSLFLFWNLRTLDKLYRSGDHLLASKNGATEKIEISDIDNLTFGPGGRGPDFVTITMKAQKPTRWGARINFIPKFPISDPDLRLPQVFIDLEKRVTELKR